MSMARDTNFRPRRSDEPSGDSASGTDGRGNDPLAELARLIGQDDPFGAVGRQGRGASRPAAQPLGRDPQDTQEWAAHQTDDGSYHDRSARADDADEPYRYDPAAYQDSRYQDDRGYETGEHQGAYGAYYDDGQAAYSQAAYGDEGYDEPQPEKRRGGIMTIAAVVGVAVIGTAAIFGYRAWTSPSSTDGEPPVIKAEQAPTKVIPAPSSTESQPSKLAYDRIGDRGGERMVPREEQPIDPRSAVRVPPGGAGAPLSTGSVLPPLPAQTQSPAMTGTEPKKVKTETIRPNQLAAAGPASQPAPMRTPNVAPAAPAPATRSLASTAPATPPATTAAPTSTSPRTALAPETGGSYVVQVASQRSEVDAQASFRALQQKYPSVLGSYQVMIRRADLGDKGVYYRAQVGPFGTAEQAKEMCSSLKSAGGQCIVQPN
jgi:SPOR domain